VNENITPKPAQVKPDKTLQTEKYNEHKRGAMIVAQTYKKTDLPWQTARALQQCGKKIIFAQNPDTQKWELAGAMFCQKRLCPLCCWRRSVKTYHNIYDIITDPDFKKTEAEFIMLGLTVENVPGHELSATLDRMMAAWQVLTDNKRQPFRRSFLGTFRALEITYNPKDKEYHPHIHVLAAVKPDYFSKNNPDYVSHKKLIEVWQEALNRAVRIAPAETVIRQLDKDTHGAKLDLGPTLQKLEKSIREKYPPIEYRPDVRIEKIKKGTSKGIAEVAKYTVKPGTYANSPEVVEVLDPALRRRRLIAYGGIFQQIYKKLKLEDESDSDFTKQKAIDVMKNPLIQKIVMTWDFSLGTYKISPYKPSRNGVEA
jgi:plasmid rolling circle replication initiator protein Rep